MKATAKFGVLKAIAFISVVFLFVSCEKKYAPTVKTVSAQAQEFSVNASGSVTDDGGEDVISYGICVSKNAVPTISDLKKECSAVGYNFSANFSGTLTGLEKNETYYVRAYALNAVGLSYGEVISVYTSTKPSATTQLASGIKLTEASLNASINPNNTLATNWFEYQMEGGAVQTLEAGTLQGKDAISISFKVSGLTPGKKYTFTAKTRNEYGTASGAAQSFKTYGAIDYDGNMYHAVTIGTQTWLRENLKTTHYLNGDPIPNLVDTAAWLHSTSGAYVYYNNDPELGKTYGCLYNWYVTSDPRGLVGGYHTPSGNDFAYLQNYLGTWTSGPAMMEVGTAHWTNGGGNNTSGFTALPNGECGLSNVTFKFKFMNLGGIATFWNSRDGGIYSDITEIDLSRTSMLDIGGICKKNYGFGIRLIKD